jgi:S1-C subfamily serine protease
VDGRTGAEVLAVTPGSSAEEVGLEAGDLIVRAGGVALESSDEGAVAKLIELSRSLAEGESLVLEYLRDGGQYSVEVEARKLDGPFRLPELRRLPGRGADAAFFSNVVPFPGAWLDLELVSLNDELGEYFDVREGVLVVRAPEDDSLGLRGGDVILEIGGRAVRSPEHTLRILRSYDTEESFAISIVRHGRSETLQATVPEHELQRFDLHDFYFNRPKK